MSHHFQSLELSEIIVAIDNSPDLKIIRRDPRFADDSLVIVRGEWTKKHRLNRMEWRKQGIICMEYKRNFIMVDPVSCYGDINSTQSLLELIGRPSKFRYTKKGTMEFRYDSLHSDNRIEETFISLLKHGRHPWLNYSESLGELKKLVENYPLPASVSRR